MFKGTVKMGTSDFKNRNVPVAQSNPIGRKGGNS